MNATNRLVAVIEIGSTGIRLLIAEIGEDRQWKTLDQAGKPAALGHDVFTTGEISRESLLECLLVLRNYQELLSGWGIDHENVHLIATSALRAARNRDMFVDRVRQETGLLIAIVEGVEENRLMYLAVRFALKNDLSQFRRANSMIIDVGGGSTEIMLLHRGKMAAAHSLRMGTILIGRYFRHASDASGSHARYLREKVRTTSEFLNAEMELEQVKVFIISGSDAHFLAARIGKALNDNCWIIERETFIRFVDTMRNCGPEECAKNFQIPYPDSEGFVPGNLVYKLFLERTSASQVVVPFVSIREGLLIDLALGVDPELQEEFYSQIIASAVNLGRKYRFDEAHNLHVAFLCKILFDALAREHGMNRRERVMLEVAATLHDIGMFIRGAGHHRHGQYIVANSEIFGLHREEIGIIANVIRYHRGAPPSRADIDYIALQREERVLVLKMASILRLADALDRGHSQRVRNITVERRNGTVVLHTGGNLDISSELMGLEEKGGMFQDIFGYRVVLT